MSCIGETSSGLRRKSVQKMRKLAAEGKVEMVIPYQLSGLEGENGQLSCVKVETLDGEERLLEADSLLHSSPGDGTGPIAEWV